MRAILEEALRLRLKFVSDVLKDPTRLPRGLDEMLRREKDLVYRGSGDDAEVWLSKLAELDTQEEWLLDLYLEDGLEAGRYERRASQIGESRRTAQGELARIEGGTIARQWNEELPPAPLSWMAQRRVGLREWLKQPQADGHADPGADGPAERDTDGGARGETE